MPSASLSSCAFEDNNAASPSRNAASRRALLRSCSLLDFAIRPRSSSTWSQLAQESATVYKKAPLATAPLRH